MLAMVVNDNAGNLTPRVILNDHRRNAARSMLAPTVFVDFL
jgi:hypothetical protein